MEANKTEEVPVEEVKEKHTTLDEGNDKHVEQTVELIQNKYTKQLASPFINQSKSW